MAEPGALGARPAPIAAISAKHFASVSAGPWNAIAVMRRVREVASHRTSPAPGLAGSGIFGHAPGDVASNSSIDHSSPRSRRMSLAPAADAKSHS